MRSARPGGLSSPTSVALGSHHPLAKKEGASAVLGTSTAPFSLRPVEITGPASRAGHPTGGYPSIRKPRYTMIEELTKRQQSELRVAIVSLNNLIVSGVRHQFIIDADRMVNSYADERLPERAED